MESEEEKVIPVGNGQSSHSPCSSNRIQLYTKDGVIYAPKVTQATFEEIEKSLSDRKWRSWQLRLSIGERSHHSHKNGEVKASLLGDETEEDMKALFDFCKKHKAKLIILSLGDNILDNNKLWDEAPPFVSFGHHDAKKLAGVLKSNKAITWLEFSSDVSKEVWDALKENTTVQRLNILSRNALPSDFFMHNSTLFKLSLVNVRLTDNPAILPFGGTSGILILYQKRPQLQVLLHRSKYKVFEYGGYADKHTISNLYTYGVHIRSDVKELHQYIFYAKARYSPSFNPKYEWKNVSDLLEKGEIWRELTKELKVASKSDLRVFGRDPALWASVLVSLKERGLLIDGPFEFGEKENSIKVGKTGIIDGGSRVSPWLCVDEAVPLHVHVRKQADIARTRTPKKILIAIIGTTGVGKSTLINSLLGYNILPEGNAAKSTTCIPIQLSRPQRDCPNTHSPFSVQLYPKTSNIEAPVVPPFHASVGQIAANLPIWQHQNSLINIEGPFPLHKDTIIVDLPGLMDRDPEKTEKALEWLNQCLKEQQPEFHLWWAFDYRVKQDNMRSIVQQYKIQDLLAQSTKFLRIIIHKHVMSDLDMVKYSFMDIHYHLKLPKRAVSKDKMDSKMDLGLQVHELIDDGVDVGGTPNYLSPIYGEILSKKPNEIAKIDQSPIMVIDSKYNRPDLGGLLQLQQYMKSLNLESTEILDASSENSNLPSSNINKTDIITCSDLMQQFEEAARENTFEDHANSHTKSDLYLCDLHTHLMGTGSHDFWCKNVLWNHQMLPSLCKNELPTNDFHLPLVFDDQVMDFIPPSIVRQLFLVLLSWDDVKAQISNEDTSKIPYMPVLQTKFSNEFWSAMESKLPNKFNQHFTFDVVFGEEQLCKAFFGEWNVKTDKQPDDAANKRLLGKLYYLLNIHNHPAPTPIQVYIIFNARQQKFQVVRGITNTTMRKILGYDDSFLNFKHELREAARAHFKNAFSMLDMTGDLAGTSSLTSFRACFTPEFFPKRYALKDSIYEQRLDVLALLLAHNLRRYQTSCPPVKYVEFSIGLNDACRPHVMKLLSQFNNFIAKDWTMKLARWIPGTPCNEPYKYAFLAGFSRNLGINKSFGSDIYPFESSDKEQSRMVRLINNHGGYVLYKYFFERGTIFDSKHFANEITRLRTALNAFPEWIVGLDLMGDELGFPFIPFTLPCFKSLIKEYSLGVRIHAGENPLYSHDHGEGLPVHMAILTFGLQKMYGQVTTKLRIGHGTAWSIMRDLQLSIDLVPNPSGRHLIKFLSSSIDGCLRNIPLELNVTSNEYLLHTGPCTDTNNLQYAQHTARKIRSLEWPFVLATDNDGIWPIEQCPMNHPNHHALAGEYCKAVHMGLIDSNNLVNVIRTGTRSKFDHKEADLKSVGEWRLPDGALEGFNLYFLSELFEKNSYEGIDKNKLRKYLKVMSSCYYPSISKQFSEKEWDDKYLTEAEKAKKQETKANVAKANVAKTSVAKANVAKAEDEEMEDEDDEEMAEEIESWNF